MESGGNGAIDVNHVVGQTTAHPLTVHIALGPFMPAPITLADSFLHNPTNLPDGGVVFDEDVNITQPLPAKEIKAEIGKRFIHGGGVVAYPTMFLIDCGFHGVFALVRYKIIA